MKPRLCSRSSIKACHRSPHRPGTYTWIDVDDFQCMRLFYAFVSVAWLIIVLLHLHSDTFVLAFHRGYSSSLPPAFFCTEPLFLCLECMLWAEIKNEVFSLSHFVQLTMALEHLCGGRVGGAVLFSNLEGDARSGCQTT